MKTETLLVLLSGIGGGVGCISNNKVLKIAGFGTLVIAGGILLKKMFDDTKKVVEEQCQETEREIEKSGLDINEITETDLMITDEENETPVFGKVLLKESYNGNLFPNDMLEFDKEDYYGTLHILQNVEKNRLIISIPLPVKNKKGMCPQDMREHFSEIFENFVEENNIDMKVFINQVTVQIGVDPEDNYLYYQELEREDYETFKEYLERTTKIIASWESGSRESRLKYGEYNGLKTVKFVQFLNLEFPVFPSESRKKGLNLISAMALINTLCESMSIPVANLGGKEQKFEFSHVIFHPENDYGFVLQKDESGKIITVAVE